MENNNKRKKMYESNEFSQNFKKSKHELDEYDKNRNNFTSYLDYLPCEILLKIIDEYLNICDIKKLSLVLNKPVMNNLDNNNFFKNSLRKKILKKCNLSEIVDGHIEEMFNEYDSNYSLYSIVLKNDEIFGNYTSVPKLALNSNNDKMTMKYQVKLIDKNYSSKTFDSIHSGSAQVNKKYKLLDIVSSSDKNLVVYDNRIYDLSFNQIFDLRKTFYFDSFNNYERLRLCDEVTIQYTNFVIVDEFIIIGKFTSSTRSDQTLIEIYNLNDGKRVLCDYSKKKILKMEYNGEYIVITYVNKKWSHYYDGYNKYKKGKYKIYFYKLVRTENGIYFF